MDRFIDKHCELLEKIGIGVIITIAILFDLWVALGPIWVALMDHGRWEYLWFLFVTVPLFGIPFTIVGVYIYIESRR